MSPIKLHHMSLTYPQTPINKSLSKAFQHTHTQQDTLGEILGNPPRDTCHKQHQRIFRSTETLLESSPKASRNFKNFNLEYEENSKQNHPNYLPRSQRSLESSSKASKIFKKLQTSKALWIQASEAPKNFHHKPSNTNNIQREIIQIIFLDLKSHWNQAQKSQETSTNHKSVKLYGFKPLKPRRTSTTNLRIRRTFEDESSKSYS